ncbi:hypothetical protein [Mycolicibacterium moriokaense]|uniref:Low molecular weight antigen MTB12-like C-terminal domain-containing protein n=1 Tax=Mycolicibacterium moriokaense TaxID=39691 RepID=A0AAD1HE49_9MYCO|nr:hypothetical protein [Mycolicibacterium moriokaense]BBX02661.1 hypothetical protein MMOR_35970 [Mycolicibacterium moriokaense]
MAEAPPPVVPAPAPVAPVAPLPPPTALSDVLNRIADSAVPGAEKTALIEDAAPTDAAAMDKFGVALRQAGYDPVSFEARDLRWVQGSTDRVSALVTLKTENPQAGDFTYPMEFTLADGSWQLARRTADELLGENSPAPSRSSASPAPPAPAEPPR